MKLSILIPSTIDRQHLLDALLVELDLQILSNDAYSDVEILTDIDSYERSIGDKRNYLLNQAQGEMISFIDDDDWVASFYIQEVLQAIDDGFDCCSLIGEMKTNGVNPVIFKHSIEYNGWYEKDKILYRYLNHLNPIKKSIAMQIMFPPISHGEDKVYSQRLQDSKLVTTEYKIDGILYYYNFISGKPRR